MCLAHCSQDGQSSCRISDDAVRSQSQQVHASLPLINLILTFVCRRAADVVYHSSDRRIPFRFYDFALVRRSPRLELWLQFHEQYHVRCAIRDLARAVPNKRSWDGERTRGSCESCLWDHGASHRPLHELGDTCADLRFCLSVYRVEFRCSVVAFRAAWEGVIVEALRRILVP